MFDIFLRQTVLVATFNLQGLLESLGVIITKQPYLSRQEVSAKRHRN